MSAIRSAIYDVLSGDTTLTNMLGSHSLIGGTSRKSIFTKEPLPNGFNTQTMGPWIVVSGPLAVSGGPNDTKNSTGLEDIRDIRCYADLKAQPDVVDAIGMRVRTLFHRASFTVTGYTVEIATADGPIEADTDTALGRIVGIRLVLKAN